MYMTHSEMITVLSLRLRWPEEKVSELLSVATEVIGDQLSEPGTLSLPGLGNFTSRKSKEFISLHPETGERYLIPPSIDLFFRVAPALKKQFEEREEE